MAMSSLDFCIPPLYPVFNVQEHGRKRREIKRNIVAEGASRGERHSTLSSPRNDVSVSDLNIVWVRNMAIATVQAVFENSRRICDMRNAKNKSLFWSEAIHRRSNLYLRRGPGFQAAKDGSSSLQG